ncbi:MAG TPA: zinc ribbon domain-containing protein [Pyrinomonadaceae bacterium]|nr:zinc ribbon domain-containing protein [Pyrinomonadaceae bacterium]
MFCPKCAAQNVEGAHFCRACGANISLVPQALTGQLPATPVEYSEGKKSRKNQPTLDGGIRDVCTGFGFLAVAVALAIFGRPIGAQVWWFWMLLPAFGMLGNGISKIVRANQLKSSQFIPQQIQYVAPERMEPGRTNELRPPVASVTEGTTRHLGTEPATRHFDPVNQKPS